MYSIDYLLFTSFGIVMQDQESVGPVAPHLYVQLDCSIELLLTPTVFGFYRLS